MKQYSLEVYIQHCNGDIVMEEYPDGDWVDAETALELLEALESMRNFMEWRYGEEDPFVMDANKAIAKAKGLDQ